MNDCLSQHGTVAQEYFVTCRCSADGGPPHHQLGCPLMGCEDHGCPAALTAIDQIGENHIEGCPLYRKNPDRWGIHD